MNTNMIFNTTDLFEYNFFDAKTVYIHLFGKIPCVSEITSVDGEKLEAMKQKYAEDDFKKTNEIIGKG